MNVVRNKMETHPGNYLIGEVEVRAGEQVNLSLGKFKRNGVPKGFAVTVFPEIEQEMVTTEIVRLQQNADTEEMVMYIANFGNETLSVGIRRIE